MSRLTGRLLVASPVLNDGVFDRTVIYLLEDDADAGSLGVVLNRETTAPLDDALPGWADLAAEPSAVFWGGPVGEGSAICLGIAPPGARPAGWQPITPQVGVVDLSAGSTAVLGDVAAVRVFSGYAGWSPGQLDAELELDAWWVLDALPDDVVHPRPDELWTTVLRRQGGRLARFAHLPLDPSLN